MGRAWKWAGAGAVLLVVAVAGGALALHRWLATEDFRQRVEREASAVLGLPLRLGSLSIDVLPLPAVAVAQVRIDSQPAVTLERVEARPDWRALLQGRATIATLVVREAVVPQQGLAAIAASMQKQQPATPREAAPSAASTHDWIPRRARLERITWVDARGARMTLDAQLQLDDAGQLDSATAKVLEGRFAGAQAKVERAPDHWTVQAAIGGGRITGRLQLQPGKGSARVLSGRLDTDHVEVAALTAPSRTLTGRLQAHTTLTAQFREPGELADTLQTQTRFTVRNAVLQGLDLAQAVKTVGVSRGGQTRLDTLAGNVATRGRSVQLSNLVASSGALAATGNVAMAPDRHLSGRVSVELASSKGTVGVPLAVGGTLDSPSVTLSRGALVGAAVGTLLAPGVGTAAGATAGEQLGDRLKGLFGR